MNKYKGMQKKGNKYDYDGNRKFISGKNYLLQYYELRISVIFLFSFLTLVSRYKPLVTFGKGQPLVG